MSFIAVAWPCLIFGIAAQGCGSSSPAEEEQQQQEAKKTVVEEKKAPPAPAAAAAAQVSADPAGETEEQTKKNTRARRLSYVTGDQSGQPNLVGAHYAIVKLSPGRLNGH